ncbi:MAG: choice-of-anchor D domain-containing protein, partial [Actinomycetota bacterium]
IPGKLVDVSEKPSFWATLPGVIAGLAAILTGAATIIAFFMGGFGQNFGQPVEEPSPEQTSSSSTTGSGSSGSERIEPQAVIAPKSIDFGSVGTGDEARESVTVINSGNEYLVIDEASITGDEAAFSVEAADCLVAGGIEPQAECEMVVTFNPPSQGSYAGVLQIEHSGPTSPNQVSLRGETRLLGL